MDLTPENKKHIDNMSYEGLLSHWRFAPAGDPWFQGETGDYWGDRMTELRSQPGGNGRHVSTSKSIGWINMTEFNENKKNFEHRETRVCKWCENIFVKYFKYQTCCCKACAEAFYCDDDVVGDE